MIGALLFAAAVVELYRDNVLINTFDDFDRAVIFCRRAGPGSCVIKSPAGETVVNIPDEGGFSVPEIVRPTTTARIPVPQDGRAVFVCKKGERGTTTEPNGDDQFDGLSMEGAVATLAKASQIAKRQGIGTDFVMCEGGHWFDERLVVDWSGTKADPVNVTYYVAINGKPYYGDLEQLCGAEFAMWKEPECPEWAL